MALRRIISRPPLLTAAATCSFHQRGGGGGGGYGGGGGGGFQGGGGGGFQGGGGGGYQGGGGGGGYQGGGGGGGYQGGGGGGFQQGGGGGGGGFQGGRGGGGGFQGGGRGGGGGGFQQGGGGGGFQQGYGAQQAVAGSFAGGDPPIMEVPIEAAKKLTDLKKICKTGRQKERTHAKIDALKILKATVLEPSTDQKTILTLLNAVAFFKAPMSYSVAKDSVEWVRKNANQLNARSIANVAYAIGAVNHGKKFDIMEKELFPAITNAIPHMQFVELCMTLQAIGRCRLTDTADVVTVPIFQRLVQNATELNASSAATALSACAMLEFPSRHPVLADSLLSQVLQPHLDKIGTYHSDVVTNLAHALAQASRAPPEAHKVWSTILARLNFTVANVNPTGVARMYEVVAAMRENPNVPCAEFEAPINQLLAALDAKVDQSATFFGLEDAAEIAEALLKLNRKLPPPTVAKLSEGLCLMMAFHNRQTTNDLGACAYFFAKARMGSPQMFRDISFLATGIALSRPPLPGEPAPPPPDFSVLRAPFTEDKKGAVSRNLSHFVRIRLGVEAGMGSAAIQNPAMGALIKYINDSAAHASAEQHLNCFRDIALFPAHPMRNTENDALILNGIIFNLQNNQHQYMGSIATPNFKDNLALQVRGCKPVYPQVAEIIKLLNLD